MTPPARVSVPVRICGLPIARISKLSRSGVFSTDSSPGFPNTTVPGHHPDALDGDRLRAGVPELVEEIPDPLPIDVARQTDGDARAR